MRLARYFGGSNLSELGKFASLNTAAPISETRLAGGRRQPLAAAATESETGPQAALRSASIARISPSSIPVWMLIVCPIIVKAVGDRALHANLVMQRRDFGEQSLLPPRDKFEVHRRITSRERVISSPSLRPLGHFANVPGSSSSALSGPYVLVSPGSINLSALAGIASSGLE
jgi:hypothetical protein